MSRLLSFANSLCGSQHGTVGISSKDEIFTVRPSNEAVSAEMAKLSRDCAVSDCHGLSKTAKVGASLRCDPKRNDSSSQGSLAVQSESTIETGQLRPQAKKLSNRYTDQKTRRRSSCCQTGVDASGSALSFRSCTNRMAKPVLTQPCRGRPAKARLSAHMLVHKP